MQIQERYADLVLSTIETMGSRVYDLIPTYRDRCPLCQGSDCAVRHGLYYRRVVGADGFVSERFPVPRFRCSRRGPRRPRAVTFSVLPAVLAPRRRLSVPLMLRIVELLREATTVSRTLDRLAETSAAQGDCHFLEELAVYRVLALFAGAYLRLRRARGAPPLRAPTSSPRARALALAETFMASRGSPTPVIDLVLSFHSRHFPRLLLGTP